MSCFIFTFVTPVVSGTRLREAVEDQKERRPSIRDLNPILVAHVPAGRARVKQSHVFIISVVLQKSITLFVLIFLYGIA